jgi:hypothetical protein
MATRTTLAMRTADDDDVTVVGPPPSVVVLDDDDEKTRVHTRRLRPLAIAPAEPLGDEPTRVVNWTPSPQVPDPRPVVTASIGSRPGVRRMRAVLCVAVVLASTLGAAAWRRTHWPMRHVTVPASASARTPAVRPALEPLPASPATPPIGAPSTPQPVGLPQAAKGPGSPSSAAASDERAAVDATASGAYAEAARTYERLAATHPSNAAYGEAVRILRERGKQVGR